MTKSEFIAENTAYLDDRVLANLEQIPDAAWDAVVKCVDLANSGGSEPGIDCDIAITHDTIDDFETARREHWRECHRAAMSTVDGFHVASYSGVQMHKGGQRRDIAVIDCGEIRVCLG